VRRLTRRCFIGVLLFFFGWLVVVDWSVVPSQAASPVQIVEPGDVATPTATYMMILFPTPTSTPHPDSADPNFAGDSPRMLNAGQVATYTVKQGDTLLVIALEVGVDVEELPCAIAPTFRMEQPLVIGDVLEVPPIGWICYQVQADETLTQVATKTGRDPGDIFDVTWNQLDASALNEAVLGEGSYLRIPPLIDGSSDGAFLAFMLEQPLSVSPMTAYAIGGPRAKPVTVIGPMPKDWPYGSGNFMWPVYGWMSQGYREDHRAIDVAAPLNTLVTSADRGVVIRAGWNNQGYGTFVVVDHNIDYITLYAHLSEVFVKEGDVVAQGQVLGTVGSTGNSSGPHLHFEIRDFGRRTNPLDLLIR
jgi:murein DD-endopeptidase MepM/ murein hydrolase activator NlpD